MSAAIHTPETIMTLAVGEAIIENRDVSWIRLSDGTERRINGYPAATIDDAREVYADCMPWFKHSDAALQTRVDEANSAARNCGDSVRQRRDPIYWLAFYANQEADEAEADSNAAAHEETFR